jgi:hypothetical protein
MAVPSAFSLPPLRRGCGECVAPLFRLIDSSCEPHCQLDSLYSSLDEAIADAIAWIEPCNGPDPLGALIGVDVRTANGDWRTCRTPVPLLCRLPR